VQNATCVDKTAEFLGAVPATPAIVGTFVHFWMEIAAANTQQMAGAFYRLKVQITSSVGEEIIALGTDNRLIRLIVVGDC
jgi:hypothetical protein